MMILAASLLVCSRCVSAPVVMNYGADGNDYFQFTNPSMAFDKASGFTTLITFGIHVNADGTLMIAGAPCATNGIYVGPANWGALVTTLKTPPTTVTRYEVLIGGWLDSSYDNIKSLVNSQGTGPGSMLYKNFQALKNAVPGIDAINDDDEQTYDLRSSTNFANMLGGLGYKFTLVPYTAQNFWVNLKRNITNCDYVYLQCYAGGAGNDPAQWNAAFGGANGYSASGFHVIPGQESNTADPARWKNWYLQTGVQGGFYYPDIVFNTTNWSAAILNGVGQLPLITLTNDDSSGTSFNAAGNWSDGGVPSSANAYVDSGHVLTTPAGGSLNFTGGSLLLNNGAVLALKNDGGTTTIGTNPATGLTLDYNASVKIANAGAADTLAGYVVLGPDGGGNFVPANGTLTVSAPIGGSGTLNIPAGNSGTVILAGANSYTGGTTVNNGSTLRLQNGNSLGANALTINSGSTLQLRADNGINFGGGNNLQGLGDATITFDVNQLTGAGVDQTLGFAPGGFNVGNSTLNFTGGHGYALALGSLTGVYAGPLTLNPTTAGVYITQILGGANITLLKKNGAGLLALSGGSTYTGGTIVNGGTLIFGKGASGVSGSLQVTNGAVCQVQTTLPVITSNATISISAASRLYLASGVNLAVGSLVLDGISQTTGAWGSSASPAAHQSDAFFSGPGILWVGVSPPVPAIPTGLCATPANAQVTLSWNAADGAIAYNIKRSVTNGGPYVSIATVGFTSGNYIDTGLSNGTNYFYVISAVNGGGASANSAPANATPGPVVVLTSSDTFGNSSFASAGHWSNGQTPSSTNNYLVRDAVALRTPQNGGNAAFLGGSLMISNSNGGALTLKAASGSTITIGADPATGLFLDNGFVSIVDNGRTESLAGFMTIGAGGANFSPYTGTMPISSPIRGPGFLKIVGNATPAVAQNGTVILSGVNTYAGGTILDTADTLRLSGPGTLGAISGSFTFSDSSNLLSPQTLDLNGTSQGIGSLTGVGTGRIINGAMFTSSTLTIGNGDADGGIFQGSIANGSGIMALTKIGTGTMTLAGTNSYTGSTQIGKGTLLMNGVSSISPITVSNGATLGGSGIIGGPVNVNGGGSITPGNAGIGVLTFNNNLVLLGNLVMEVNKSTSPSNDLCIVNGSMTNGAGSVLIVTNLGPAFRAGDTFRLFNKPVSGFGSVNLPVLNAGDAWANRVAVDGTIRVVSTNPASISMQLTGATSLVLSWPADHNGWRLQAQTNDLSGGLGTNWTDVTGTPVTNQVIVPVAPANSAVFFRLVYP